MKRDILDTTEYTNAPAMLETSEGVTQEVEAPMCSKHSPNSLTEPIWTHENTGYPVATWDQDFNDPRPRFYTAQYIAKQDELYGADRHAGRDFDYEAFREDMADRRAHNQSGFSALDVPNLPERMVTMHLQVCSHCGTEFRTPSRQVKICSESCRVEAKRAYNREYAKKWQHDNPERAKELNRRSSAAQRQRKAGKGRAA